MRGSRPGERRGGRQKGTPNKKTAFRNAVIAARSADENLTPLDVMLAVMRDPQVSLADRVKMALKALPRLHRKPKAGQSGNAIAGSRAATVQSFGTPKDAAGGGTGKDAAEEGDKCPGLMPLDFLLSVIRHPKTPAALQVKVSLATLPYIHPKQSSRPPKPAVVANRWATITCSRSLDAIGRKRIRRNHSFGQKRMALPRPASKGEKTCSPARPQERMQSCEKLMVTGSSVSRKLCSRSGLGLIDVIDASQPSA